jgi:hypothetical protein
MSTWAARLFHLLLMRMLVIILLGDPPPASSGVHTLRNKLHGTLFTPEQSPKHRREKCAWNNGFLVVLNPHLEVQRLTYRRAYNVPAGLRGRKTWPLTLGTVVDWGCLGAGCRLE